MQLPEVGSVFHGRYRLEAPLGRGGFAAVFEATDLQAQQRVALKILLPGPHGYPRDVALRFEREVRLVSTLSSPRTVRMLDFGRAADGLLFMAFELIRGRSLTHFVAGGGLPEEVVAHVLEQVLDSLIEAHNLGLIHRDLKPDNILVFERHGDPWSVKVIDFGIAKDLDSASGVTATGHLVGTPRYMSPEQLTSKVLTPASDLYTLGVVAFEMLFGTAAMHGVRLADQLERVVNTDGFAAVGTVRSTALRETLLGMLTTDVGARIPTAAAALGVLTGRKSPTTQAGRAPVETRRDLRSGWIGAAVLGVALLIGAAIALAPEEAPQRPQNRLQTALTPAKPRPQMPTVDAGTSIVDLGAPDLGLARLAGRSPACDRAPSVDVTKNGHTLPHELRLTLPANYDHAKAYPLVLFFHDANQSAGRNLAEIGVDKAATKYQFVGMTPREHSDFNLRPWRTTIALDVTVRAVEAAGEAVCIDRDALYVIGTGDGGRMVERLRCLIPAIVGAAATGYRSGGRPCATPSAVPYMQLVGRDSTVYPAKGGFSCLDTLGRVPSRSDSDDALREAMGCQGLERTYSSDDLHKCRTWNCSTPFVSCDIDGGHGWHGTNVEPYFSDCYGPAPQFDQFGTIWKFFQSAREQRDP